VLRRLACQIDLGQELDPAPDSQAPSSNRDAIVA
jgi:hypothetical protein